MWKWFVTDILRITGFESSKNSHDTYVATYPFSTDLLRVNLLFPENFLELFSQERSLLTVANILTKFAVAVAYAVSNTENVNLYLLFNLLIYVFVYVYVV